MSKRNRREHGRILSVETMQRGSALDVDAAAGATSITVTDAGDFDEDGGWLYIGAQVVEFTACDDDTGVITLADPLTAAAEQGDPVAVYDPLYGEVVDYQIALVQLDGEYDNPDPVEAEVAEGVEDLPEGDRGRAGESCTLKRVADDEWEVVEVGGRSRKSRGLKAEADDHYVLTAADITAGVATVPLSHRPADEWLILWWRTIPQEPTEYTINYDAQTITYPLSSYHAEGDRLWAHYAYRKGLRGAPTFTNIEFTSGVDNPVTAPAGTAERDLLVLAITLPSDMAAASNLNGYTLVGETASVTHLASALTSDSLTYRLAVYARTAPAGAIPVPTFPANVKDTPWVLAAYRGSDGDVTDSVFTTVGDAASATIPALAGADIHIWATISRGIRIVPEAGSIAAENGATQIDICAIVDAGAGPVTAHITTNDSSQSLSTAGWLMAALKVGV